MVEERRKATTLDSEGGKEMKCPKCGCDVVVYQEKKDRKIEMLNKWLDSEDSEWEKQRPGFKKTIRDLLELSNEHGHWDNIYQTIRSVLRIHPDSPIRRGSNG